MNVLLGILKKLMVFIARVRGGDELILRVVCSVIEPVVLLKYAVTELGQGDAEIPKSELYSQISDPASKEYVLQRVIGELVNGEIKVDKHALYQQLLPFFSERFILDSVLASLTDGALSGYSNAYADNVARAIPVGDLVPALARRLMDEEVDRASIYKQMLPFFSERYLFSQVSGSLKEGPLSRYSDELLPALLGEFNTQSLVDIVAGKVRAESANSSMDVCRFAMRMASKAEMLNCLAAEPGNVNNGNYKAACLSLVTTFPESLICRSLVEKIAVENEVSARNNGEYAVQDNINSLCSFWIKSSPTIENAYSKIKPLLFKHSDIYASQEGEDILLKRLLKQDYYKENGFYIDVGAYHPFKYSTTLHYYLRGWSGLNIDPVPNMKEMFDLVRPRDINVQAGVSLRSETLEYHEFKEPAFNTFSSENMKYAKLRSEYLRSIQVKTYRLDELLDRYLKGDEDLIFCNIDVEGFEDNVLGSNNWTKYRPKILLVENIAGLKDGNSVLDVLGDEGYLWVARTKNTNFYIEKNYYDSVA